jgi:putative transposase
MIKKQTYPSDLTDDQWQVIWPMLPKRKMGKAGRPRKVEQRGLLDAIFYILRSTCPWRLLPHDFPPWGDGLLAVLPVAEDGAWVENPRRPLTQDPSG